MLKGFKEFISRGNMIDMAVGVVMGAAVTAVVNAIVKDLINPLVAMIFGKPNMDNLFTISFNHSTISFGGILSALLNFLIIAVAVYFFIVVPINKFQDVSKALAEKMGFVSDDDKDEKDDKEDPQAVKADPQTLELLGRIADNLDELNHRVPGTSAVVLGGSSTAGSAARSSAGEHAGGTGAETHASGSEQTGVRSGGHAGKARVVTSSNGN